MPSGPSASSPPALPKPSSRPSTNGKRASTRSSSRRRRCLPSTRRSSVARPTTAPRSPPARRPPSSPSRRRTRRRSGGRAPVVLPTSTRKRRRRRRAPKPPSARCRPDARGRHRQIRERETIISAITIKPEDVRALRERTGAGVMDCKRALEEAGGDVDRAIAILRERGLATAARKAGRAAREGVIASYIHHGSRLGVLLELNCETDFVARTGDFQGLARELAMQVAGLSPRYISRDDVPADVLEARRARFAEEAEREGKPAERVPTIV